MYGLHPVLMSLPPPPGPPPPPPPVWGDHYGYWQPYGKRWVEVGVPDKGWNEDHPVRDEQGAATNQGATASDDARSRKTKEVAGRRVEKEKDDRGGEDNKCRSKEEQHDRDVPHTPHNTLRTVNIYSIGIQQTLDPRRSVEWGLTRYCPDVLPVHQIEDVTYCGQDKVVSGQHCGENLNTLYSASTCVQFHEFAKALPEKLHRHFRDSNAAYTLVIVCRNGRHRSVSWARLVKMMLTGQYRSSVI